MNECNEIAGKARTHMHTWTSTYIPRVGESVNAGNVTD
jgi:hypothetical protein